MALFEQSFVSYNQDYTYVFERTEAGMRAIRVCREDLGLSQERLAKGIGMQRTRLSEIEMGHRDPRLSTLRKIAGGLGISVDDLLLMEERNAKSMRELPSLRLSAYRDAVGEWAAREVEQSVKRHLDGVMRSVSAHFDELYSGIPTVPAGEENVER
jgi:transcriptional regulator with XRE-family HTH domain